ncbi:hypothetical protein VNO77_28769 [Canavalia gladiata]|uniref:Histidine-containing phosphotransfer protein n=1 Tax=Canavalia gladiata TaxID=3824 RepID=A0AAN9KX29_CANGL
MVACNATPNLPFCASSFPALFSTSTLLSHSLNAFSHGCRCAQRTVSQLHPFHGLRGDFNDQFCQLQSMKESEPSIALLSNYDPVFWSAATGNRLIFRRLMFWLENFDLVGYQMRIICNHYGGKFQRSWTMVSKNTVLNVSKGNCPLPFVTDNGMIVNLQNLMDSFRSIHAEFQSYTSAFYIQKMTMPILKGLLQGYINSLFDEGVVNEKFNETLLLKRTGEPDCVVQLIEAYFADVEMILSELSRHVDNPKADFCKLASLAHEIKDRSTSIGAEQIRIACSDLIKACDEKHPKKWSEGLLDLRVLNHQTKVHMLLFSVLLQLDQINAAFEKCVVLNLWVVAESFISGAFANFSI